MTKKRSSSILILVFFLAFLAANFNYPTYFNRGVDFVNAKIRQISQEKVKISLPHMPEVAFRLGLDLQGGSHLLYEADMTGIEKVDYPATMQRLRDRIERRVNNRELSGILGTQEVMIQTQEAAGRHRLVVDLPGIKDSAQAIQLIGETPFLEFKEQRPDEETQKILAKIEELKGKTFEEMQTVPDWTLAFEDPYFVSTSLTGKYIKRAEVQTLQNIPKPVISLEFDAEGAKIFADLTEKNVGKPIAIYIDNQIISAPVVQEKINEGSAQISGNFTIAEAKTLVSRLNEGALPVPIRLISQETVGPTLGKVSLETSIKAGLIGFIATMVFMVLAYRLPGAVTSVALIINAILVLTIFKLVSVTLTLSGIAGFILSVGMAVDANILIFARMKEELALGKNFPTALQEGFNRAWPSIRDSNVITLITSAILFEFGTSFIKGFASTLSIGIFASLFSAFVITKFFLRLFEGTRVSLIKWLWR